MTGRDACDDELIEILRPLASSGMTLVLHDRLIAAGYRKHPEPEITDEMVERGAEAISEMHTSSYVGDFDRQSARAALDAALRLPVGEGEQSDVRPREP